ncbi:MAG: AAA family ATPase [Candidatus Aenigmarchaeota archaeon]|nr:AAA family ATPase [Candidatus Aenigmarchaeota archaeon]NIQ18009.1 AAA family ATPase [Candidatus Aenigmarchaeota archaeon]
MAKKHKHEELVAKFNEFLEKVYKKELMKASNEGRPLVIEFSKLYDPDLSDLLLKDPERFFGIAYESLDQIELPNPVKLKVKGIDLTNIRDLRSRHIGKFSCVEGVVRRASEIRPEIIETIWECPDCNEKIVQPRKTNVIFKPMQCTNCGNKQGLKQVDRKMIDTRWITIDEPFELTEGERPSQLNILLTEDLVSPEGRRLTDPGNRIKITGILREIPKGKYFSVKLDFYLDSNFVEPVEIGLQHLEITKEDEKEIKKMTKDPLIYDKLVDSLAPSLYGMKEIKESIILQLFGGVHRTLKDGTHFRGDVHILLIGDPSSGKSQLMKLVPQIVPRGKYVSGKGVTGAGLTATVTKDEQFMGGWVLEAGALVLTNKGLLAIDEFEKMTSDDQIAMHEALEQGSISIAKASIVATLPAQTSVLAGGNPKFSRFDPYMPIAKQITIPDTLLTRFDLKFALRDVPQAEMDKKIVDHVLKTREEDFEGSKPKINQELIRKYIAYTKQNCEPTLTPEAGKIMRRFYINMRKRAEGGAGPIPITLRQFEALIRLAEASARIQLNNEIRKEDAQRAIRLMRFSLTQLGFDTETGQIDIDRAEGASVSSSERSRIRMVMDIINDLSEKTKEISISEIQKLARKEGVEEVDDIIEKLKREGLLFEPNPGYVQKV